MSYPIAVNDIVEVQLVGRIHGQRTRNVFHYRCDTTVPQADGQGAMQALAAAFNLTITPDLAALSSNEQRYDLVTAQVVSPVRYQKVAVNALPQGGTIVANSLPSSCAWVCSFFAAKAGRKYQGRKFFSGIPIGSEADSRIDPQLTNAYTDLCELLRLPQSVVVNGNAYNFFLTLARQKEAANVAGEQDVESTIWRDIIRVQRRREIDVGE